MEAVKFAAVLLAVVFVQILGALGTPLSGEDEGGEMWTVENWQGYPLERGITIRLADLIKRSKAQQFHGLMGRSLVSGASKPTRLGRKRNNNKGEMFVGLMGRRSLGDIEEDEWNSDSY
ncbi:tachykinin-4 [Odontesthes bonariensis]|uniref:tachykinin-4 n=1 Tax=Odontesthes bonariensis TaxID=219752 RepID=UPI003F58AD8D